MTYDEILRKAQELGFDDAALTEARLPEADKLFFTEWIEEKRHGDLAYLENDVRLNPQAFFPGAKTAILFASYYKAERVPFTPGRGVVASYARGRDYHNVHRKRLKKFIAWLEERSGEKGCAKGFSDSAPVLEKALAAQAGLGWMGKNTLLIHRRFGTYFLLAGLLTTLELPVSPLQDTRFPRCGSCTKCLDACPTQALKPYEMDAVKCLSYHLIEHRGPEPKEISDQNPGYLFGCDLCQDVCPHNVRPQPAPPSPFSAREGIGDSLGEEELRELEAHPEKLFGTPLNRRGVKGLRHTLDTLVKQKES